MNYNQIDNRLSSSTDEMFGAIADVHRRYALYYLRPRKSVTRDELATVLAGWLQARDDQTEVVTPDERERMEIALHHVHLPRLADAGLVEYDYTTGQVTLGDVPDVLDVALDRSLANERRASERVGETESD